jgi:DNA-binding transcriptional LysR family regulator
LLCPVHVLAVLPKNHRLGRRSALDVTDVIDQPLLLLNRSYWYSEWFYEACRIARIKPRVAFESVAAQTLVALAAGGHGIALLPAGVLIRRDNVHAAPLLHRGTPIGRWRVIAWHPQRFFAPYAKQFVDELVTYCRRDYPNRDLTRRAPPMPRPKEPVT